MQQSIKLTKTDLSYIESYKNSGIESKETLESNVTIWSKERNRSKNKIEWKFSRQDADNKLSKHYVS